MYQAIIDDNTSLSVEIKSGQIHIDQKEVELDIHQVSAKSISYNSSAPIVPY